VNALVVIRPASTAFSLAFDFGSQLCVLTPEFKNVRHDLCSLRILPHPNTVGRAVGVIE
jgi:hypothetical protein